MTEISNKTLVVLLVVAIVISVGGAVLTITQVTNLVNIIPALQGITGMVETGRVNVSVTTLAQLDVVRRLIDFGVGYVAGGQPSANLESNGSIPTSSWTADAGTWTAKDMQIANTGTVDININVSSSAIGTTMIGGTGSLIAFDAYENETTNIPACSNLTSGAGGYGGALANLTTFTTTDPYEVCKNVSYIDSKNSLNISIRVVVPQDATAGNKTATLTFAAARRQ